VLFGLIAENCGR